MKKSMKWLGFGGLIAMILLVAMDSQANDLFESCMANMKKDCRSWAAGGGGGEAPRGLTSETKAELAIGERYILTGTVSIASGDPYLRVSFADHPWLASKTRKRTPFYRLDDLSTNWKQYTNREITIVATARYSAWADSSGRTLLEIYLEPADEPVITGLQRIQNRR